MVTRANDLLTLRSLVHEFVRGFGLLSDAETPCGQPLRASQAHALLILLQADGAGLHQAALAERLGIDKSNTSRLVRQLADKGQVVVSPAPDEDGRIKRVCLTQTGIRVAKGVDRASRERFGDLLENISPSRRSAVFVGLEQLVRALERSERTWT